MILSHILKSDRKLLAAKPCFNGLLYPALRQRPECFADAIGLRHEQYVKSFEKDNVTRGGDNGYMMPRSEYEIDILLLSISE